MITKSLKSLMRRIAAAKRIDRFMLDNRGTISTGGVLDDHIFDFALSHVLSTKEAQTILQIGANTGDTSHDMRDQIERFQVNALLVEPQPGPFEALRRNYKSFRNVSVANVAVGNRNEIRPLYRISDRANRFHARGGVFGDSIGSFDEDHPWNYFLRNATEEGRSQSRGAIIEEVEVQCATIESLLDTYGISKVDVLAIDTEGFDFEIIKLADAAGIQPRLIKYEHKHIPGGVVGARASWKFLIDRGYTLVVVKKTGDTVGWKTE